jgi:C4-type Zn-finger protein
MPIGYAEQEQIRNHLQGWNNNCPVCQANNWTIFEDFVSPFCVDIEYKRPIEGKLLPMVVLICSDCGYVRQISAVKVGLIR